MKYDYPKCRKADLTETYFGRNLAAPYTWLRDTQSAEVRDFTRRENAFTDNWFQTEAPGLVDAMIARLKAEQIEALPAGISPWGDGYLATEEKDGNYAVITLDGAFRKKDVLFRRYDLPQRTPFSAEACPADENLLAVMAQADGAPRPDYLIYDCAGQAVLSILPMTFSGVWSKRKKVFYAATTKVEGAVSRTAVTAYDAASGETKELFVFPGSAIFGSVRISEDGAFLLFAFSADYSNDFCCVCREDTGEVLALNPDRPLPLHYIDSFGGKHFFLSFDQTPHGQVISIDEGQPFARHTTVYTETRAYLEAGYQLGGKIYLKCSENGAGYLFEMASGRRIPMPERVASLEQIGKTRHETLFAFDAFLSQPQILSFDGRRLQSVAGSSARHEDLTVELLFAPSKEDKTPIPYYLVRRKDAPRNSENKALFYGYGGYNVSMPPWSTERISQTNIAKWVESGGVYVHCLLRGGNEYGSPWHEAGMGMNKKNCYSDFIGIAEQVIADGWTRPARIAISGCSNGGLLMSALVTMRPDLWGCVIDSVPHTDMIHFADDDRGAMYITEYGDPKSSPEAFDYLLSYSPLHNVREAAYPPTYIQTGECDNNVPPYHGKSFAAAMQEKNRSDNPILLRVLEKGSHDRGQGEVFWQTVAEMHVFMEQALK